MRAICEGFLLGIISMCSLVAGLFFLKFWRRTGDFLFLAFAIAFLAQGANSAAVTLVPKPNEGSPVIYLIRLLMSLLILVAIVKKNLEAKRRG